MIRDRCMHRLSIPEIHPICYNCKAYNPLIYNWLCQARNGISGTKYNPKHYTQSIDSMQCLWQWHNIVPQELNWCQWKSVAHAPRPLAETKHIGIMSWAGALPNTIGMWLWDYKSLPKDCYGLTSSLSPQLSMLYVHTISCIKQMTLWRWTNPINSKI